jgi:APA family basic amino acid/polyamine antiporter
LSTDDTQRRPKRVLGSGFTLAVIVGGTIGLGILRTPGEVAAVVPDPWMFVSLWVLSGLFILLSTIVAAELVGMTPRSGGTYSLVRRAYGPFPGFVIGWVDWLTFVADIAFKAVVVTEFAALLFPEVGPWRTPLGIMVSTVFAALQLRGVALGAKIQEVAAAGMALIVVGFTLALAFSGSAVGGTASGMATAVPHAATGIGAWSLVVASAIYTYDGWTYAAYFSGEIKGGGGAVARACIKGTVIVIVLYVFLVAALAWKVPLASLADDELALAAALEMVVSPLASTVVLVAAIIMLLAHQNLLYMSTPRILQALAVDGLALRRAGEISKRGNPIFAVLLSWGFSVGLIMVSGFEFLLHLSVFFFLFIYVVLIVGILILRSRQPDADRPYRAWGHPWTTWACLLGWVLISVFQAVAELHTALYAAIMVAVAWPVYRAVGRTEPNTPPGRAP